MTNNINSLMTIECWCCGKEFVWTDDMVHTSCDTINGQYVEYLAVMCPFCHCTNEL